MTRVRWSGAELPLGVIRKFDLRYPIQINYGVETMKPHHTIARELVDVGWLPEFPIAIMNLESPAALPLKKS